MNRIGGYCVVGHAARAHALMLAANCGRGAVCLAHSLPLLARALLKRPPCRRVHDGHRFIVFSWTLHHAACYACYRRLQMERYEEAS